MTATEPGRHEPTVERGSKPDIERPRPTASLGWIVVVAAVVVIALVVSGTVAVAHGVPIWALVAGAFVGAVAGISGGRLILRLLLPEPAPDSTTSTIDLRLDDDRID